MPTCGAYSAASCLAHPSFYEGLASVLEAMACGTPVLTAWTSSLPEVAGKAAVYADRMILRPWPMGWRRCSG